jgi:CheY-like chemotaxis protein
MRLLIIEDEARIAEILRSALSRSGFAVDAVGLSSDARAALEVNPYDAVILDLGLPDGDGLALLKDMRARGNAVPVLVLTARDAVEHRVAGTDVEMVQATDYPWNGKVSITVNPKVPKNFSVSIRVPSRNVSKLYKGTPDANGITSVAVNGRAVKPVIDKGYAVIARDWKAGDRIDLVLPLKVQRVRASEMHTKSKSAPPIIRNRNM